MHGYGRWLQLSVFQCRLTSRRRAELGALLDREINHKEDRVLIFDVGKPDTAGNRVESMGCGEFAVPQRRATVL